MEFLTKNYVSFIVILFFLFSCNSIKDNNSNENKNTDIPQKEIENDCNCSERDANSLASKIMNEYNKEQNELPSDIARLISLQSLEKRQNCSWVATFKTYQVTDNLTGTEPQIVKKRFKCDGVEIYVE